jgi:hypothetical protein
MDNSEANPPTRTQANEVLAKQKTILQKKASPNNGEDTTPPEYWTLVFKKNTRNSLLLLTDKYVLPDYPLSDTKKQIMMEYRTYLRDFININTEAIMRGEDVEILPIPF